MVASAVGPAPLVRDVLLRDGWTLRLQTPMPVDLEDIRAFYDGLSEDSRYLRFHGFGRTDAVARADAEASGVDRLALIGRHEGRVVAVASYDGLREPGVAEVAFAVADEDQRRGIGMRMLEQLAAVAAERGIHRFVAEVVGRNELMLGVFEHAGFAVRRRGSDGEVMVSLDITPTKALQDRIDERDHVASIASLRPLLAPRSVAVVGASEDPASVGGRVLRSIIAGGFRGLVWPVNRSGGIVCSAGAVRALADLPEPPELALIAVPAGEVAGVVEEAGGIGVRAVLVISAGFADAGERGSELQRELLEIVRAHGMRMVGPNSLGVANRAPGVRLHATVAGGRALSGGVAILSQSGALGLALLGQAQARGLGVASFLSVGNRADVSTNDLLEYWQDDDAAAAIVLYVESFGNPQRFAQIALRVSRRKPILVVKGRLTAHVRAAGARSHTATALRSEDVFDALFRHAGVLRLDSTDELFDLAELLERQPLPAGRNVGVVTNSGGLGTLATDASLSRGLSLPRLSPATQQQLAGAVPHATSVANPVDLTVGAQPGDVATTVHALLRASTVDAVVVLFIALNNDDAELVIDAVERAAAEAAKPVVSAILGPDGQRPRRAPGRVPNYRMPEAGVAALARAADRRAWLSRPLGERARLPGVQADRAREVVVAALNGAGGDGWMRSASLRALLDAYGIPLAPSAVCQDPRAAVAAAERFDGPVVLKASLPAPGHAGDIDAVLLGLTGEDAIRAGWQELRHRVRAAACPWTDAVIVQPLIDGGADILVGSVNDPDLGPLVGLGLGGRRPAMTHVITFRLAPTTDTDAEDLIAASAGVNAWLEGFAGGPPLDRLALHDLLMRFSRLVTDTPELAEADLNAIRVLPAGCFVLDARLRLAPLSLPGRTRTW
jgi:acetate---CoA ligase (ADP-forming)